MKCADETSFLGTSYGAEVTERVTQNFNSARLLEKVKAIGADWLLKEVVDEDKLESEIITGKLSAKDFSDCVDITKVKIIKFKKLKRQENVK